MLSHRFAIGHPPQNSRNTTNPPNGVTRTRGLTQFYFLPAPRAIIFQCTVLSSSRFFQPTET